jgi:L-ascorbate metabolism protein UlaG (beta-lactamase superfamily)
VRVTYIGHSTVLIEVDGVQILTDPALRDRIAHLRRRTAAVDVDAVSQPDLVLISHIHQDHLDRRSLRMLTRRETLVLPPGGARMARGLGFERVIELSVGETAQVADVNVRATPAKHEGRRKPIGPSAEAVGYLLEGSARTYFAGDTGLFDEMSSLAGELDLALIPIWGWGPRLKGGHMTPEEAARALALLRPRIAIPIHWGTFSPIGSRLAQDSRRTDPARAFVAHAKRLAPSVEVVVLEPGESVSLG